MTYFDDGDVRLYCADALEALRELPDQSVHMACTSPPFFGLRDYGTGTWEGGDEGHEHDRRPARNGRGGSGTPSKQTEGSFPDDFPAAECSCGAIYRDPQIGLEASPDEWATRLVDVFREVRRVLRDDGTLWVECGDSYVGPPRGNKAPRTEQGNGAGLFNIPSEAAVTARVSYSDYSSKARVEGLKQKDLIGAPWLLAFALRADGWYLRSCIIWAKPNCMPESVTDRPTTAHSYVFLFSKRPRYFFDQEALREPYDGLGQPRAFAKKGNLDRQDTGRIYEAEDNGGRNARSVWQIPTEPNALAICRVCDAFWQGGAPREHCGEPVVQHFAAFPRELVRRMILAGTSERGVCAECGAPWVRELSEPPNIHPGGTGSTEGQGTVQRGFRNDGKAIGTIMRERFQAGRDKQTLGWNPSCDCCNAIIQTPGRAVAHPPAPPVPATILDPFAGSGTALLVARQHGRHAIGIELNERYAAMCKARMSQLSLLA